MKKTMLLSVFATMFVVAGAVWLLSDPAGDTAGQIGAVSEEQAALDRTRERTLRESRSGVEVPPIEAAPVVDSLARAVLPPSAEPPEAGVSDDRLPEGYTLGTYRGSMQRAPRTGAPGPQPSPNPDWLGSASARDAILDQAARSGRPFTFAVLRVLSGTDMQGLDRSLRALSSRVEGSTGAYVRIRVPAEPGRLEAIASLPDVLGIGAIPPGLKADEAFVQDMRSRSAGETVPVYITLMARDPSGEWRRALSGLGAVVGAYDSGLRSYTANLPAAALAPVMAADFVLSVEPVPAVAANHASAVPVMGVDGIRRYDPGMQRFSGVTGSGIAVGVLDTGLNTSHMDIAHGRASICGANFVAGEDWDLWLDLGDHGTHVFGTIAGAGRADPLLAGMAPDVSHLRFGKILSAVGVGSGDDVRRGMDYLSGPSSCWWQGAVSASVKPLIVNMSLGASSLAFSGRGVGERKLDSVVYAHSQLYVVAQSNEGVHGFSNYGTAKNSLAVGAVDDAGIIAGFSSQGPTADGRLAPNVVGTGVALTSARGGGSITAHNTFNGTSMAAPSVAGVVALLMQARPEFQNRPALTRARLMASAIRPDVYLESPAQLPADNTGGPGAFNNMYGLGLVSARTSLYSPDEPEGWLNGSASSEPGNDTYEYIDIEVPDGARRLDVVLTWDETPADTLTRSVLNNLDLWADRDADCEEEACGEYASRSEVDNVEWLLIEDPAPGTYRIKVVPVEIYSESSAAAVAWTILLGDAEPELDLVLTDASASASAYITVDVTVDASRFVASGTTLHLGCRAPRRNDCDNLSHAFLPQRSRVYRSDGLDWSEPYSAGGGNVRPIPVGEVAPDTSKRVQLSFLRDMVPPGSVLSVTASSWNATAASGSLAIGQATDNGLAVPAAPANDNFLASERLEGAEGETALDLALASREPGEPPLSFANQWPPLAAAGTRTLWYAWEAPASGLFRFRLREVDSGYPADAAFALFTGDGLVDLEMATEKQGNEITFAADAGAHYRLRISSEAWDLPPLVLEWESADSRPANDDFAYAQAIEGERGSVDASNEGATLESSEFHGGLAATVWFEWTAPKDGLWIFRTNLSSEDYEDSGLIARVYEGARVGELRLLSQPEAHHFAVLLARRDETYRIAVASGSADDSGRRFTLNWETELESSYIETADRFADAVAVEGGEGFASLPYRDGLTVEPGEPAVTGIGTAWWRWTAPTDGRYTWRLDGPTTLQLTVFTGVALADLQLVGSSRGGSALSLDATANTRYWIAVGRAPGSAGSWRQDPYVFTWGPTPVNDGRAAAIRISGAGGSTEAAGLAHATASPQDPADNVGTDSVWWQWSAPASGWHRFWIGEHPLSTILSVYPGNGARQAIATSERSFVANGRVEAWVAARAGETYDIRLSARPRVEKASSATLLWEKTEAPAFLAYKGATATDYLVLDGKPQVLREPTNLTMSEDGEYLFSTAANGLFAFRADAETDELSLAYRLEIDSGRDEPDPGALQVAHLWWNTRHNGLTALSPSKGYSFALPGGGSSLLAHNPIAGYPANLGIWADSPNPGTGSPDGRFFYALQSAMDVLQVYRVDSLTQFALVQEVSSVGTADADSGGVDSLIVGNMRSATAVALAPDGSYLYLVAERGLFVFSVDSASGKLGLTREILLDGAPGSPFNGMDPLESVAVDRSGAILFVSGFQFSSLPAAVAAFDVSTDPSNPRHLDTLSKMHAESDIDAHRSWSHLIPSEIALRYCGHFVPHAGLPAVDVVCQNGYYVVSWNRETEALEVADFAMVGERDRFGNTLPYVLPYALPDTIRQSATSPDGGRVYFASSLRLGALSDAIHVFQRASAMEFDSAAPPGSPTGDGRPVTFRAGDTLTDLPTGSRTPDVTSGGSFTLSGGDATVRLDEGGYIEEGGHRYTCQSSGGCVIENRRVTAGTVVQTASGAAPGGGVSGDHGDDRATAAEVGADSDTQGDLTAGDVDYFRVVVDAAGTLEAYTSGGTDTLGRLEDADGAVLGGNDDGGAGTNFRISEDMSAGTYFIRVAGYSSRVEGEYTLHVRFTGSPTGTSPSFSADSEPGDQTYTVGTAIDALTLPAATGGTGDLTYSLSPEVPGLQFDASTRELTGTPSEAGAWSMTYRVRDASGDSDWRSFTVTVSGGTTDDTTYEPLEGLRVSPGLVQYGIFAIAACFNLPANLTFNGVTITLHSSWWQRRDNADSPWEDVPDTERQGGLCALSPTESGEYRLVGDITVDGTRGNYSSENTFTVE